MIVYRRMHVLAWNHGAAALLTDFDAVPARERNLVRLMFLDNSFRALYPDWSRTARDAVAVLRMEAGRHPDDPDLIALVGELSIRDHEFRTVDQPPSTRTRPGNRATSGHPLVGTLTLDVHQLSIGPRPTPSRLHRPGGLSLTRDAARPPPLIRCLHRPGRKTTPPTGAAINRSFRGSPDKGSMKSEMKRGP